ncbi:hypothetical protein BGZ93_005495 [Podila epicladia]|nr:hypothetical protein BGZ92_005547 [Podila epicladia]KAG0095756.1 hypothetical protein BGZ93_005495 [Podila epicladia]
MSDPSGFPSGTYPQPIGSFSGGASSSTASGASLPFSGTTTSTLPPATTYVGGQQFPAVSASGITNLAAAAAAAAAISSPKKAAAGAGAAATKTGKRPYKKSGANSKRGGGSGGGRGGGSAGGQGARSGGGGAGGSGGGGDGDKDSDDDEDEPEVSIEEQFILRLPPGEMCDRFREKVIAREIDESVNLKFKDSRRGTFTFEGLTFTTKLVDLPNIIEAQKTLNGKQMYKIADISQMLIVDGTPEPQPPGAIKADGNFLGLPLPPMKPSEYTWPDGLSMALKNVRRRRFRKRVSKAAVEGVENEIERLLHEDALAEEVQYDIREQVEGMEEGMDQFDFSDDGEGMGATPAPDEGGNQNSDMDMMDDEEMMEEEEEEEDDDDDADEMMDEFQRDLEREMEKNSSGEDEDDDNGTPTPKPTSQPQRPGANVGPVGTGSSSSTGAVKSGSAGSSLPNLHAMQIDIRNASGSGAASSIAASGAGLSSRIAEKQKKSEDDDDEDDEEEDDEEDDDEEDEDDDDDDSGSDEDDDDDEDDKEKAQLEKMLKDEIKELNGKIRENQDKLNSAPNEILKKRFGSILETLRKELELKTMQLEETKEHAKDKKKQ